MSQNNINSCFKICPGWVSKRLSFMLLLRKSSIRTPLSPKVTHANTVLLRLYYKYVILSFPFLHLKPSHISFLAPLNITCSVSMVLLIYMFRRLTIRYWKSGWLTCPWRKLLLPLSVFLVTYSSFCRVGTSWAFPHAFAF